MRYAKSIFFRSERITAGILLADQAFQRIRLALGVGRKRCVVYLEMTQARKRALRCVPQPASCVGSCAIRRLNLDLREARSRAVPYWRSEERWRARALLSAQSRPPSTSLLVGTTVLFTYWQRAFYNALGAKDWHGFIGSLFWWYDTPKDGFILGFAPVLVAFVFITSYELYLRIRRCKLGGGAG